MHEHAVDGWGFFAPPPPAAGDAEARDLARAAARLFATPDGQRLLTHLRRITTARTLGPDASDAQLRHLEGQRSLVLMLEGLAARGRT